MPKETRVRDAAPERPGKRPKISRGRGLRVNGRGVLPSGAPAKHSVGSEDMLFADPPSSAQEGRELEVRGFRRVNVPKRYL